MFCKASREHGHFVMPFVMFLVVFVATVYFSFPQLVTLYTKFAGDEEIYQSVCYSRYKS